MNCKQLALSAVFIKFVFWCGLACSQETGSFAIEGHIFDAKTLKPLASAYVVFNFTVAGGAGGGVSAYTDANGFYQMESTIPPTPLTVELYALCRTKKADVQVNSRIYGTLRDVVYRRDFYVTLPKNISRCNL